MLSITRILLSKPLRSVLCTPSRQTVQRTSSSLQQPRSGNMMTNPTRATKTTTAVQQQQQQQRINYTTSTLPLQKQYTVPVPTMGDSITEGTIVEWIVPEGAAVSEGDVLCLIETDKVTVDIKAEKNGVLIRHLGEVEGVVEVGEGLYVLDEDASIAVDADAADVEKREEDAAAPTTTTTINTVAPPSKTRVPSIHFLGKEGWKQVRSPQQQQQRQQIDIQSTTKTTTTVVVPTTNQTKPHAPTSITYQPYVHMYGRPSITEEEMEALLLGGAEEAPVMKVGKDKVVTFYGGRVVTAGPRGVWLADEGEEGM